MSLHPLQYKHGDRDVPYDIFVSGLYNVKRGQKKAVS